MSVPKTTSELRLKLGETDLTRTAGTLTHTRAPGRMQAAKQHIPKQMHDKFMHKSR
jgi:hypothetical protein